MLFRKRTGGFNDINKTPIASRQLRQGPVPSTIQQLALRNNRTRLIRRQEEGPPTRIHGQASKSIPILSTLHQAFLQVGGAVHPGIQMEILSDQDTVRVQRKISPASNSGQVAEDDHGAWYRALFAPNVTIGLLKPGDLRMV